MRINRYYFISVILVVSAQLSFAEPAPNDDSLFYYKIGGGRDIAIPPSLNITTIDLSLNGSATALTCSGFDPMERPCRAHDMSRPRRFTPGSRGLRISEKMKGDGRS